MQQRSHRNGIMKGANQNLSTLNLSTITAGELSTLLNSLLYLQYLAEINASLLKILIVHKDGYWKLRLKCPTSFEKWYSEAIFKLLTNSTSFFGEDSSRTKRELMKVSCTTFSKIESLQRKYQRSLRLV